MSTLDKITPSNYSYGINKDQTYKDANQVTFALNGIRDSHDGGKTQYHSEPGNELVASLPADQSLVGWIYGKDNEVYLLSTDDTTDMISIFKEGKLDVVATINSLGFERKHPITGEFRVKNGCERIIYWCDGRQHDYWFNFDRPDLFQDSFGAWDPNKFKLVPIIQAPVVELMDVLNSGGILPLGSYYFQIEILDGGLNSIYKTDISPQTIIYDESSDDQYNNIDGGLNAPPYDTAIGGVPVTSKSIQLKISNLDTSFDYIRVNVIRQIAGTGAIDAHAVGSLIPISDDIINFTYVGYLPEAGDYPIDYTETLIPNAVYESAYVMEQVQGRLLRANLKQNAQDYSAYQALASAIQTEWVAKEIERDEVEPGNSKDPHTYWINTTFQSDEVYAFGIRYLHKNGMWSPVFHIPGRAATMAAGDMTMLFVVPDATPGPLPSTQVWERDVLHLDEADFDAWIGTRVGSNIRRWKVFNTGAITSTAIIDIRTHYTGRMGYYETETTYPDISDCNGNSIWGEDYNGNTIIPEVTKIRHHKFPDRRTLPHYNSSNNMLLPLGVKFQNIAYANTDVIGHQFCYVRRNDATKQVLDTGWFGKTWEDINLLLQNATSTTGIFLDGYVSSIPADAPVAGMPTGLYGRYSSGNILFNQRLFNGTYLKTNNIHRTQLTVAAPTETFPKEGGGDIEVTHWHTTPIGLPVNTNYLHYKIDKQALVQPKELNLTSTFGIPLRNADPYSSENIIKVTAEIENVADVMGITPAFHSDMMYTYKKANVKPYGSLFNLFYNYINFNVVSTSDAFSNTFYNGDSLIVLSYPTKLFNVNWLDTATAFDEFLNVSYDTFYEEQQINFSLPHGGLTENRHYKLNGDYGWTLSKVSTNLEDGTYRLLPFRDIKTEYYKTNIDYKKQSLDYVKVPLPITYNYCSECLGNYPNRIIFSPRSFDEESFDLYRINKINDYIDIPANRGAIKGLKYQNNLLLVMCEDATFILQPNPQVLQTDTATAYLTTGDFLSIPPAEIMANDIGYAGMQNKQHQCNTPYGHCWIDQKRGQIFKFNGQMEELSNKGLTQWFKEYLPSDMKNIFWEVFELPWDNTSSLDANGVSIVPYYDPRFKRLIISKKDFLPINFKTRTDNAFDTTYNIITDAFQIQNPGGGFSNVLPTNDAYFENKSWTVSFSFEYDSWTSWHSYRPWQAFWDDSRYYTLGRTDLAVNQIWEHLHKGSYQKYYDTKKDFIIEWMIFDMISKRPYAVHYLGQVLGWDTTHKRWKDYPNLTFNKGIVYNESQSTGLFDIIPLTDLNPYANSSITTISKYAAKADKNHKIAGIYDISTDTPVNTADWNQVKGYGDYIDHVPNSLNLNDGISPYINGDLWDNYVVNRLFFKPDEDVKQVIILSTTNETKSIR